MKCEHCKFEIPPQLDAMISDMKSFVDFDHQEAAVIKPWFHLGLRGFALWFKGSAFTRTAISATSLKLSDLQALGI